MPVARDLQSQILQNSEIGVLYMGYNMKKSGERIRQLRIQHKFTQGMVAETLNIDRSFYSRIEAGKYGCSVDLFVQLSNLFGVSLDYLILGIYGETLTEKTERTLLKADITKLMGHLEKLKASL